MAEPSCSDIMVAGPGSHLVMPDYTSPESMGFLWFTEDGRVLYLLPWEGSTLAGTTDNKGARATATSDIAPRPRRGDAPEPARLSRALRRCDRHAVFVNDRRRFHHRRV